MWTEEVAIAGRSVLDLDGVKARTSLGRSAIYATPGFPKPVKLTAGRAGRVGWLSDEIDSWIAARAAEREAA